MIASLALALLLAQAILPTPPPAPVHENQAPVKQVPAPFAIPTVPGIDRVFALAAVQGNDAEIDMAELAIHRASAPEVKSFARKMIGEHMGMTGELMAPIMHQLGAPPSQRLSPADLLATAHLQTISDVDFDQVYALQQVGDHLATLTVFRTEADNGTDPQLKMLARKWIPTIQAHLELAVNLAQHIGGSSPLHAQ